MRPRRQPLGSRRNRTLQPGAWNDSRFRDPDSGRRPGGTWVATASSRALDAIWRLRRHRFSSRHSAVCVGPRRIRFNGLESLTRREVEVARLASQGYMASEIGDRLQISVRTVESHLAHVYTKLGVTSRRALIRMSARLAGQQGGESPLIQAATPAP
ncbi:MAG: helix-turn-helix transcriptional regulator [Chloroflexi bacterium]|nr:MAG: helix-turn-helix transcriptional regulator [Chloroflexota bacterium]